MNVIREINRINERELALGGDGTTASWHDDYKDSAYVFVGGLPFELTEGDVITIMSQFGEIADINMPRDKETGKPKGFAFIMYEDQRSTVLAVDNMTGGTVLGRTIRVDHVKDYKQPGKRNEEGEFQEPEQPSMNALPPVIGGSDASSSSSDEAPEDEDPMAAYIRAERKKAKSSSSKKKKKGGKHEGESKEERRARKALKKAEKAAKKGRNGPERSERGGNDRERRHEDERKPRTSELEDVPSREGRRDRGPSPLTANGSRPAGDRYDNHRMQDRHPRRSRSRSRSPPQLPRRQTQRSPSPPSRYIKREPGAADDQDIKPSMRDLLRGEEDVKPFAPRPLPRSRRSVTPPFVSRIKREPSPVSMRDDPRAYPGRRDDYSERQAAGRTDRGYDRPTRDRHYGSRDADSRSRRTDTDWRSGRADTLRGTFQAENHERGPAEGDGRADAEGDYASWRSKRDVERVMRRVGGREGDRAENKRKWD